MTKTTNTNTPAVPPVKKSVNEDENNPVNISEALSIGWKIFKENIWISLLLVLVPTLLQFIPFVGPILNLIIAPGIIYAFIKIYDKKQVSLNDVITKINKVFPYLGVQIIIMFIIMGSVIFFIIPEIIALTALIFTIFLLIDKNMSVMESIRTSWAITKGYRWKIFILILLFSIPIIAVNASIISIIGYDPTNPSSIAKASSLSSLIIAIIIPFIFFSLLHIYRKLLAQAEKNNILPVEKLQTWPKVFLWVGIILLPLAIFASVMLVALGPARERAQQQYQNQMNEINTMQNNLQNDLQDNSPSENTMEDNAKDTTNDAM